MLIRAFHWATAGLLFLPAAPLHVGGWAVITVTDLPEYFSAEKDVTINFVVRQHGQDPLNNLPATLTLTSPGAARVTSTVSPARDGYSASFKVPTAGNWSMVITAGFNNVSVTLPPIPVVAKGDPAPAPLTGEARGRQLYTAKGCMTCHSNGDIPGLIQVGPAITPGRLSAEYIEAVLLDPTKAPKNLNSFRMPNLGLTKAEAAALAAYVK